MEGSVGERKLGGGDGGRFWDMGEGGGREEEEGEEIGVPHSPILLLDHIQIIGRMSLFGNIDANRQNKW